MPSKQVQMISTAIDRISIIITLCTNLSGAVYCNRSCLFVCGGLFVCLRVCYYDNSKLRASIFTKLDHWLGSRKDIQSCSKKNTVSMPTVVISDW